MSRSLSEQCIVQHFRELLVNNAGLIGLKKQETYESLFWKRDLLAVPPYYQRGLDFLMARFQEY